jgi:N-acetylneuraminic acid mutarotase
MLCSEYRPDLRLKLSAAQFPVIIAGLLNTILIMCMNSLAANQDLWEQVADLPEPNGLKGIYAGIAQGHVVLAGGSNFPIPPEQGGRKSCHRTAYVSPADGSFSRWLELPDALPRPLAEGAAVSVPEGMLCIGGSDGTDPANDVFLVTFDTTTQTLVTHPLPSLPMPLTNAAAVLMEGYVYVANGADNNGATQTFLRMKWPLTGMQQGAGPWEDLPAWPAAPRFGAALLSVKTQRGWQLLLAGGIRTPVHSADDYLRDAWLYEPGARRWTSAAPMPRPAVLPAAVSLSLDHVALLGGSSGHNFARMRLMGESYRIPDDIMLYAPAHDLWTRVGSMPLGVVSAGVVPLHRGWLIAGGEYSPGRRTRSVYHWNPEEIQ